MFEPVVGHALGTLHSRAASNKRQRFIRGLTTCTAVAAMALMSVAAVPQNASAWTASLGSGQLTITAASGEANQFSVSSVGGSFQITDVSLSALSGGAPAGCTAPLTYRVECPALGLGTITVQAGDGNDTVSNASSIPRFAAFGGAGSDQLSGGALIDELHGEDDNDVVSGGVGDDQLGGGDGDDTLSGGTGHDQLSGAAGSDELVGGEGNDTITGGDGSDTVSAGAGSDNIDAGGDNDVEVSGGEGSDQIDGGTGDDNLSGGDGNDTLSGGDGSDTLSGSGDSDTLNGGNGEDTLQGGFGSDQVHGGDGGDEIEGGDGSDTIFGEAGSDAVVTGAGNDTVWAGAGDDLVQASTGSNTLNGEDGNDTISSGDLSSTLTGGAGDDRLTSGDGTDTLDGGDGNDTINPGRGSDSVSGGGGDADTATYEARSEPLAVSLDGVANDGAAGEAANIASSVENVVGGQADDVLSGSDPTNVLDGQGGSDQISGGQGDDRLLGRDGDDTLRGAEGADVLAGGEGTDTASYSERSIGISVTLDDLANDGQSGEGDLADVDNVIGGQGPDRLVGSPTTTNSLIGGAGDDSFDTIASAGDSGAGDSVACGDGNDSAQLKDGDTFDEQCETVFQAGVQVRPALPPDPEPPVVATSTARLRVLPRQLKLSQRTFGLKFGCVGVRSGNCTATVLLRVPGVRRAVAFRDLTVAAGRTKRASFTLPKRVAATLARKRKLKLTVLVRPRGSSALLSEQSATVRLTASKSRNSKLIVRPRRGR